MYVRKDTCTCTCTRLHSCESEKECVLHMALEMRLYFLGGLFDSGLNKYELRTYMKILPSCEVRSYGSDDCSLNIHVQWVFKDVIKRTAEKLKLPQHEMKIVSHVLCSACTM